MKELPALFIILLFFSTALISQESEYQPMIKKGSFWDVVNEVSGATYPSTGDRYRISGDTIINSINYKKLQKAPIRTSNENLLWLSNEKFINSNEFVDLKHLFLREDIQEKTVFIYVDHNIFSPQEEIKKEYTYCDFSLNIGDEMVNAFVDSNYSNKLEVTNVYQSLIYNKTAYDLDILGIYVEGIGKITYPFESYNVPPLGEGQVVSSMHCYGNEEDQNNCASVLSIKEFNVPKIKFFPNPAQNVLTVENKSECTIKIYSLLGKILQKHTSHSTLKLDISSLKKGIYILEIKTNSEKQISRFLKI